MSTATMTRDHVTTATITSKGQVTLPKAVRDHLRLDQGDRVEFVVEADGSVKVRPLRRSAMELYGILRRPGVEPPTIEEIDEEIAEYLAEEDERIKRQWHEEPG